MRDSHPSTADAVIIGGGVMGCSILYNLAARGLNGAVLFERASPGFGLHEPLPGHSADALLERGDSPHGVAEP